MDGWGSIAFLVEHSKASGGRSRVSKWHVPASLPDRGEGEHGTLRDVLVKQSFRVRRDFIVKNG